MAPPRVWKQSSMQLVCRACRTITLVPDNRLRIALECKGCGRSRTGGVRRWPDEKTWEFMMLKFCLGLVALSLLPLSTGAGATSICRWVNESGRTQIAEVVPEKYREVAVCTDSHKYELSPEQRRAAEKRAADDKARARQAAARPPEDRASNAPRPTPAASQPGAKRPTEVVTDDTSCTTWWRIYDESVECFGPYRTTRGATKPAGFDKCNVVSSPEPKCGPRSN